VWATLSTTGSPYQRDLIARFAADVPVQQIACPGLAEAIEAGDDARIEATIARAVAATDDVGGLGGIVLGCTHFGLVSDRIAAALPAGVELFDSPAAVARQTLSRLGLADEPDATPAPIVAVLHSGRRGTLPAAVHGYRVGARLLQHEALTPG
jgi:glutamate racemase